MSVIRHPIPGWLFCAATVLAFLSVALAEPVSDPSIVSDKVIARIDDGDFVHPAFSPDGKRLAYARVAMADQTELAEVYVRELASGATWRLLDAKTARKYAVYKAFIYRLQWVSNDRLVASVSDGDVGTTLVEFDVAARRIVSERGDEDGEAAWYAEIETWMSSVSALPEWKPAIVQNAFENGVALQDGSYLIQPQYAGVSPDVFHITRQGRLTQLTRLTKDASNALCGGLQVNDSLLFLLAESRTGNSRKADLLRYHNGQIETLDSIATLTEPGLKPLHVGRTRALFFVATGYAYQRSPGVLYEYAAGELRRWPSPNALHSVTVDASGRMLLLVMWQDERRIIELREIGHRD